MLRSAAKNKRTLFLAYKWLVSPYVFIWPFLNMCVCVCVSVCVYTCGRGGKRQRERDSSSYKDTNPMGSEPTLQLHLVLSTPLLPILSHWEFRVSTYEVKRRDANI